MVESERRGVYGLNGIKITGGIPLQGEVQIQDLGKRGIANDVPRF